MKRLAGSEITTSARFAASAAVGVTLFSTSGAWAADDERGFDLGGRLGYATGFGDVHGALSMDETLSGHVPIWLDLGYRLSPKLLVGLYGQYGFGFLAGKALSACDAVQEEAAALDSTVECTAGVHRFGFQVHYRIKPERSHNPWLGLGVGQEWLPLSATASGAENGTVDATLSGIEFNLQFGWDFDIDSTIRLGPFIALSTATYDEADESCTGLDDCFRDRTNVVTAQSSHQWLWLGARVAVAP